MQKYFFALVGVVAILGATTRTESAQSYGSPDRWEELGCVDIGRRPDRDVVEVGRREGRFNAIRLKAMGNDVQIEDLKVVYGNGKPDDIRVRSVLREGQETRALDLQGRERAIDRVELWTKRSFKGRGRGRAKLCVFALGDSDVGRPMGRNDGRRDERDRDRRTGRQGGNWDQLGCQKVGFLADRDVIRVGRREGRFKSIRLEVSGNSIYVMDLKVVYANGQPDDIAVRSEIREGGQSGPLDLRGRERSIDRVELVYRAKPNFRGSARVCVSGRG